MVVILSGSALLSHVPLTPAGYEGTSAHRPPPLLDSHSSGPGTCFKLQHLLPVPHPLPLCQTLRQQSVIAMPESAVTRVSTLLAPSLSPAWLPFLGETEECQVLLTSPASQTMPALSLWVLAASVLSSHSSLYRLLSPLQQQAH